MIITEVKVNELLFNSNVKAIASVTFDDQFVLHDVKVIDGKGGLFVAMPSRKSEARKYIDIAHPLNTEFRNELQSQVMAAYKRARDTIQ